MGHSIASVIVLSSSSSSSSLRVTNPIWRVLPAILFACHPVHVENIVYCVGFADTLSTIFMAGAFMCCSRSSSPQRLWTTTLCILSALSKESGFVSFALVFLVRFLRSPTRIRNYMWELLSLIAAPIVRFWYVGGAPVNFAYADVPYIYEPSSGVRGLSYLHVHSIYGRLLLLPWNMSWDYSFDAVPLVRDLSDLRILGSLTTYLAVIAVGWICVRIPSRSGVTAFALFILPFIPASSLFLAVGTVVGERLLYPVTFGLAAVLGVVMSTRSPPRWVTLIFIFLVPVYAYLADARMRIWSSKFSLYATDALAWPRSCKTLHQYGAVLMNDASHGGVDAALPVLAQSLSVFDDNALTDYLVSQILLEKGDLSGAISVHNKIANGHGIGFTDFSRFMFLVDAGYALVAEGRVGNQYPINLIEEGLEIYGWVPHARNAAAVAYLRMGNWTAAIGHLEVAISVENFASPKSEILWNNLAVAYLMEGDKRLGAECLTRAIQMGLGSGGSSNHHPVVVHNVNWINGNLSPEEQPKVELFYTRLT